MESDKPSQFLRALSEWKLLALIIIALKIAVPISAIALLLLLNQLIISLDLPAPDGWVFIPLFIFSEMLVMIAGCYHLALRLNLTIKQSALFGGLIGLFSVLIDAILFAITFFIIFTTLIQGFLEIDGGTQGAHNIGTGTAGFFYLMFFMFAAYGLLAAVIIILIRLIESSLVGIIAGAIGAKMANKKK